MSEHPFLTDVKTLRARASQHIEQGAVTAGYRADRRVVLRLLNEALATEIVCTLRYKRHAFAAAGIQALAIKEALVSHAGAEQEHADNIAARIIELGGLPNFSPEGLLTRSHAEYVESDSLADMIKADLIAERIAIDSYSEVIAFLGDDDPTTKRMLEQILAEEEKHATFLAGILRGPLTATGRPDRPTDGNRPTDGSGELRLVPR